MQDWRRYQEDAAAFFRSFGFTAEVDKVVKGARAEHVIDVAVGFARWGMRHLWVVECKKHRRRIEKRDVEALKSIKADVGASVAILLSESGFQSGAVAATRQTSVILSSLHELRAASRDDLLAEALAALEARARELQQQLNRLTTVSSEGLGSATITVRPGVDCRAYLRVNGVLAMARAAFDDVHRGLLPVTMARFSNGGETVYARAADLEAFAGEATALLDSVAAWLGRQHPDPVRGGAA